MLRGRDCWVLRGEGLLGVEGGEGLLGVEGGGIAGC